MGQIAIKDDLYRRLQVVALERGVPIEQQADEIMRDALVGRTEEVNGRALMESIAAMTPPGEQRTDSVELLRQDRNR